MTSRTVEALDHLIAHFITLCDQGQYPVTPYDPEWPSPCYRQTSEPGMPVCWQPVRMESRNDMFSRLKEALEENLYPDLIDYYSRYWSDPIPCHLPDGTRLSLLFVWNEADMERLRANLIGHALNTRAQKRALTLFVGVLEADADDMITLNNQDGSIWLERPGKKPHARLADSLADFLEQLTPISDH